MIPDADASPAAAAEEKDALADIRHANVNCNSCLDWLRNNSCVGVRRCDTCGDLQDKENKRIHKLTCSGLTKKPKIKIKGTSHLLKASSNLCLRANEKKKSETSLQEVQETCHIEETQLLSASMENRNNGGVFLDLRDSTVQSKVNVCSYLEEELEGSQEPAAVVEEFESPLTCLAQCQDNVQETGMYSVQSSRSDGDIMVETHSNPESLKEHATKELFWQNSVDYSPPIDLEDGQQTTEESLCSAMASLEQVDCTKHNTMPPPEKTRSYKRKGRTGSGFLSLRKTTHLHCNQKQDTVKTEFHEEPHGISYSKTLPNVSKYIETLNKAHGLILGTMESMKMEELAYQPTELGCGPGAVANGHFGFSGAFANGHFGFPGAVRAEQMHQCEDHVVNWAVNCEGRQVHSEEMGTYAKRQIGKSGSSDCFEHTGKWKKVGCQLIDSIRNGRVLYDRHIPVGSTMSRDRVAFPCKIDINFNETRKDDITDSFVQTKEFSRSFNILPDRLTINPLPGDQDQAEPISVSVCSPETTTYSSTNDGIQIYFSHNESTRKIAQSPVEHCQTKPTPRTTQHPSEIRIPTYMTSKKQAERPDPNQRQSTSPNASRSPEIRIPAHLEVESNPKNVPLEVCLPITRTSNESSSKKDFVNKKHLIIRIIDATKHAAPEVINVVLDYKQSTKKIDPSTLSVTSTDNSSESMKTLVHNGTTFSVSSKKSILKPRRSLNLNVADGVMMKSNEGHILTDLSNVGGQSKFITTPIDPEEVSLSVTDPNILNIAIGYMSLKLHI